MRADRDSARWLVLSGTAHAGLGDHDRAFPALEKAFKNGFRAFSELESSPELAPLRSHPRFQQVVERYRRRTDAR